MALTPRDRFPPSPSPGGRSRRRSRSYRRAVQHRLMMRSIKARQKNDPVVERGSTDQKASPTTGRSTSRDYPGSPHRSQRLGISKSHDTLATKIRVKDVARMPPKERDLLRQSLIDELRSVTDDDERWGETRKDNQYNMSHHQPQSRCRRPDLLNESSRVNSSAPALPLRTSANRVVRRVPEVAMVGGSSVCLRRGQQDITRAELSLGRTTPILSSPQVSKGKYVDHKDKVLTCAYRHLEGKTNSGRISPYQRAEPQEKGVVRDLDQTAATASLKRPDRHDKPPGCYYISAQAFTQRSTPLREVKPVVSPPRTWTVANTPVAPTPLPSGRPDNTQCSYSCCTQISCVAQMVVDQATALRNLVRAPEEHPGRMVGTATLAERTDWQRKSTQDTFPLRRIPERVLTLQSLVGLLADGVLTHRSIAKLGYPMGTPSPITTKVAGLTQSGSEKHQAFQ